MVIERKVQGRKGFLGEAELNPPFHLATRLTALNVLTESRCGYYNGIGQLQNESRLATVC